MNLLKLNLINFKNYPQAEIDFNNKINCLIGDNGAGKTNILDAIHYLSLTKSYFNNIDTQNIFNDSSFFSITGHFFTSNNEGKSSECDLIQCIQKRNQKKQFKFNKKEYDRLSEHIGKIPLVMISPFDSNLIYEGSDERRKYFDRVFSQLDKNYMQELIQYNKVLEQRNRLLKNMASENNYNYDSLIPWDEQLCSLGQNIFDKRKFFIEQLQPIVIDTYSEISDKKEEIDIIYESQLFKENLNDLLLQNSEKDRFLQYTGCGIHKDDFNFSIFQKPLKKFASQGQQKSFLISLKLAQFDYTAKTKGYKPILLFDDLFDKLDDKRVDKLIKLVNSNHFGQVFITETHKERILNIFNNKDINSSIFEINKGIIKIK